MREGWAISARADLARLVLHILASGCRVPTQDALQLRNWAVTPEDAMLPLAEIARHILSQEKNRQLPKRKPFTGPCAEMERLNRLYLDAVTKVFTAARAAPTSSEWRAASERARAACMAALAALKRHKKEHGC